MNGSDAPPVAPKIPQYGFTAATNQDEQPTSEDTSDAQQNTTPLMVTIPMFDNVHSLPTPMNYTPTSPANLTRSPVGSSLHVAKRRGGGRNLLNVGDTQQRVISELPPIPPGQPQRIVSLPAVSEESSEQLDHNITPPLQEAKEEEDPESILSGYLIDDYKRCIKWQKVKPIGEGNFSDVYLYQSVDTAYQDKPWNQVAVKRIKYSWHAFEQGGANSKASPDDILSRFENSLTRELHVLKSLDYPCIVKLYGINDPVFIESKKPVRTLLGKYDITSLPSCDLIMSYCAGGDLLTAATTSNDIFQDWFIQRVYTEVILAVKYLHERNVIHRDLKLENILLKYPIDYISQMKDTEFFYKQNLVELADFGLCKQLEPNEMCTARCGSEDYVSPEILMGLPYSGFLSDVWALGVILYGLLEDRLPFDPIPNATARQRNRLTAHRIARYDWRWLKMKDTDSDAKEIVEHALTRKSQRWTVQNIYESSYIQEVAKTLLFK